MTRSLVEHYGSLTRAFRAITQDGAETRQMQRSKRQLWKRWFNGDLMVIYGHLMVINGLTNNGESWNDMGFPSGNLLQFAIEKCNV